MVNLETLKLSWIKQFCTQGNSQWFQLVNNSVFNVKTFVKMGPLWHHKKLKSTGNPFWKVILSCWIKLQENYKVTTKDTDIRTPLWNNPNISFLMISFIKMDVSI